VTLIRFSYGAATSVGRVRQVNEDSHLAVPPLFVVADGMGGHGGGNVASRIAVEEMRACVALRPLFAEAVLTALEHANRHILGQQTEVKMGTTATGIAGLEAAGDEQLMVFNVGDSRVYRLEGDRLRQLTVDHSEVQELVLAGVITAEQARIHPRRNVVTRALGGTPRLRADHWLLPAVPGDRYLICSDGLYGELADEAVVRLLGSGPPQLAADALVAAACDAGGRDNVTALVVDIDGPGSGPARSQAQVKTREQALSPELAQSREIQPAKEAQSREAQSRRGRAQGGPVNVGLAGLGLITPES
jgi:serine/threonine protein phosphatase PrpC